MNQASTGSIMVIGNDAHFCYLMQSYIRESASQVLVTSLLDDALALASREQPTAIILEIDNPGNEGWYLLRGLKAGSLTCRIPVVLCSWLDEQKRGIEEGAATCLRRPILYKDFISALTSLGLNLGEVK